MNRQFLACHEIIARGVDPGSITKSAPRRIRKSAFMPRANGQDDDGLSVSMVHGDTLARLRRSRPHHEGVTLHVGHVRNISAYEYRLDVAADPIDGDPCHALIVGFPPRHLGETAEERAVLNLSLIHI